MKELLISGGLLSSETDDQELVRPSADRLRSSSLPIRRPPADKEVQDEASPSQVTLCEEGGRTGPWTDCSGKEKRPQMTLKEVSRHCSPHDCWIVIVDRVYDITEFLQEHPGGEEVLLEHGGVDATWVFQGVAHSAQALAQMSRYHIGDLVEEERLDLWRSLRKQLRRLSLSG